MRRIRDRDQYLRFQLRRMHRVLARRDREDSTTHPVGRASIPVERKFAVTRRGQLRVSACSNLSMRRNPEESIEFFNLLLENMRRRKSTHVLLDDVEVIDYEAILVLLSIVVRFKAE